jgi:hypothetical protein
MSDLALDDAKLAALIDVAFEYVCAQPFESVIDPAKVLPVLDDALAAERTADFHGWIGVPLRERLIERAKKSAGKLAAWLPADVSAALDEQLARPVKLPRKAIDDAVASEQVREGVRQLVTETLDGFVNKALAGGEAQGGSSGGGGLRGVLSFGARAAAGVGKGLLGGIGEELQKQLQEKAKGFVDSSMAAAQKRLADRIASEETAKTLGKRRQKFFQKLLERSESEAGAWVEKSVRWKDLDASLPKIVAHNLARQELREAIEGEVRAVFDQLAKESIGSLLDRAGVKQHARDWARTRGLAMAKGLVETEAFKGWLAQA